MKEKISIVLMCLVAAIIVAPITAAANEESYMQPPEVSNNDIYVNSNYILVEDGKNEVTEVYWDINKNGVYDYEVDELLYEGNYCSVYMGKSYDIDEAKVIVNGGIVTNLYGGIDFAEALRLSIKESTIVVNGGTVSNLYGGSDPCSYSKGVSYSTIEKANIEINGGTVKNLSISGQFTSSGSDTIEESCITVNGGIITTMYFKRGSYASGGNYVTGSTTYTQNHRTINKSSLYLNAGTTGFFDDKSTYDTNIIVSGGSHLLQNSSASYREYYLYNSDGQRVQRAELTSGYVSSFSASKLIAPKGYNVNDIACASTSKGLAFWLPVGEHQLSYDGIIYKADLSEVYAVQYFKPTSIIEQINPDGTITQIEEENGIITETTKYPTGETVVKVVDEAGETSYDITGVNPEGSIINIYTDDTLTFAHVVELLPDKELIKRCYPVDDCMVVEFTEDTKFNIVDKSSVMSDVVQGQWYYDAAVFAAARGLLTPNSQNLFNPTTNMSRAMVWTVLFRFDNEETATEGLWYQESMDWAVANGITNGASPSGNVTREQFVTLLYNFHGTEYSATDKYLTFVDGIYVDTWAVAAVSWAVDGGIITGRTGNLIAPRENVMRAEAATMFMRYIKLILEV